MEKTYLVAALCRELTIPVFWASFSGLLPVVSPILWNLPIRNLCRPNDVKRPIYDIPDVLYAVLRVIRKVMKSALDGTPK